METFHGTNRVEDRENIQTATVSSGVCTLVPATNAYPNSNMSELQKFEKDIARFATEEMGDDCEIALLRFLASVSDQVRTGASVYSPDYRVMNILRQHIVNHPCSALTIMFTSIQHKMATLRETWQCNLTESDYTKIRRLVWYMGLGGSLMRQTGDWIKRQRGITPESLSYPTPGIAMFFCFPGGHPAQVSWSEGRLRITHHTPVGLSDLSGIPVSGDERQIMEATCKVMKGVLYQMTINWIKWLDLESIKHPDSSFLSHLRLVSLVWLYNVMYSGGAELRNFKIYAEGNYEKLQSIQVWHDNILGGTRNTGTEDKFIGKLRDASSKLMAKDGESKSWSLNFDNLVTASIAYVLHRKRAVVENEDILDNDSLLEDAESLYTHSTHYNLSSGFMRSEHTSNTSLTGGHSSGHFRWSFPEMHIISLVCNALGLWNKNKKRKHKLTELEGFEKRVWETERECLKDGPGYPSLNMREVPVEHIEKERKRIMSRLEGSTPERQELVSDVLMDCKFFKDPVTNKYKENIDIHGKRKRPLKASNCTVISLGLDDDREEKGEDEMPTQRKNPLGKGRGKMPQIKEGEPKVKRAKTKSLTVRQLLERRDSIVDGRVTNQTEIMDTGGEDTVSNAMRVNGLESLCYPNQEGDQGLRLSSPNVILPLGSYAPDNLANEQDEIGGQVSRNEQGFSIMKLIPSSNLTAEVDRRQAFFRNCKQELTRIIAMESEEKLKDIAQEIEVLMEDYPLPETYYGWDLQEMKDVDDPSLGVLPSDLKSMVYPRSVGADGNCAYRSFSVLVFGHEGNHIEMRIRAIISLIQNGGYLTSPTMMNETEPQIFSTLASYCGLTETGDISNSGIRRSLILQLLRKDMLWATLWHIAALACALDNSVRVIYPHRTVPVVCQQRKVFNRVIYPPKKNERSSLNILWTWTKLPKAISQENNPPNHFVPCLYCLCSLQKDVTDIKSSHLDDKQILEITDTEDNRIITITEDEDDKDVGTYKDLVLVLSESEEENKASTKNVSVEKHLSTKSKDKPNPLLSMPNWDNLISNGRNENGVLGEYDSPQEIKNEGQIKDEPSGNNTIKNTSDRDIGSPIRNAPPEEQRQSEGVSEDKEKGNRSLSSDEQKGSMGVSSDTEENDTATKLDKSKACENERESYNPQEEEFGEGMKDGRNDETIEAYNEEEEDNYDDLNVTIKYGGGELEEDNVTRPHHPSFGSPIPASYQSVSTERTPIKTCKPHPGFETPDSFPMFSTHTSTPRDKNGSKEITTPSAHISIKPRNFYAQNDQVRKNLMGMYQASPSKLIGDYESNVSKTVRHDSTQSSDEGESVIPDEDIESLHPQLSREKRNHIMRYLKDATPSDRNEIMENAIPQSQTSYSENVHKLKELTKCELEELQLSRRTLQEKINAMSKDLKERDNSLEENRQALEESKKEHAAIQQNVDKIQGQYKVMTSQMDTLLAQLNQSDMEKVRNKQILVLLKHQNDDLRIQLKDSTDKMQHIQSESIRQVGEKDRMLESEREVNKELQVKMIQQRQQQIKDMTENTTSLDNEVKSTITDLSQSHAEDQQTIIHLQSILEEKESCVQSVNVDCTALKGEVSRLLGKLSEYEKRNEELNSNYQSEMQNIQLQNLTLNREKDAMEVKIQDLTSTLDAQKRMGTDMSSNVRDITTVKDCLEEQFRVLEKRYKALENENRSMQVQSSSYQKERDNLLEQLRRSTDLEHQLKKKTQDLLHDKDILETSNSRFTKSSLDERNKMDNALASLKKERGERNAIEMRVQQLEHDHEHTTAMNVALKESKAILEKEVGDVCKERTKLKADMEALNSVLQDKVGSGSLMVTKLQQKEEENKRLIKEVSDLRPNLEKEREQITHLLQEITKSKDEKIEIEQSNRLNERELSSLRSELAHVNTAKEMIEKETDLMEEKLSTLRNMIKSHRVDHEEEKEKLLSELDSMRKRDSKLHQETDSLKEQVSHLKHKEAVASDEVSEKETKTQNQELKQEIDQLRKQIQGDAKSSCETMSQVRKKIEEGISKEMEKYKTAIETIQDAVKRVPLSEHVLRRDQQDSGDEGLHTELEQIQNQFKAMAYSLYLAILGEVRDGKSALRIENLYKEYWERVLRQIQTFISNHKKETQNREHIKMQNKNMESLQRSATFQECESERLSDLVKSLNQAMEKQRSEICSAHDQLRKSREKINNISDDNQQLQYDMTTNNLKHETDISLLKKRLFNKDRVLQQKESDLKDALDSLSGEQQRVREKVGELRRMKDAFSDKNEQCMKMRDLINQMKTVDNPHDHSSWEPELARLRQEMQQMRGSLFQPELSPVRGKCLFVYYCLLTFIVSNIYGWCKERSQCHHFDRG
jgi:chromosome segregation ATPase